MRRSPSVRVSLSTIAKRAGVSISTVSRIANGKLDRANEHTVRIVQGLLDTMGYRPDRIGQALRGRETRVVAMLAPNLNNPAMAAMAMSTEVALRASGYVMILCDTFDQAELQDQYLDAMYAQSVQGFIMISAVHSPRLSEFMEREEPIVFVGRRPARASRPVPFVGIDNRAAGAAAADFMLGVGISDIGVIHSSTISSAVVDRVDGFLDQLNRRGVNALHVRIESSNDLQHLQAGYDAAKALTAAGNWPKALFCISDMMAYGAYRLAVETGFDVPRDCLIVGVDDNPLNEWITPWLSSVRVPYADFGDVILAQLRSIWAGEPARDRLLPHSMVDRYRAGLPSRSKR